NSAVDFQQQIDSGMASPSSSISGGVPLSAEIEDNPAIPPGSAEAGGEPEATVPSKIGSRFTSGAIKVLRTWFERHEKHPYPTPKDVDRLQNQTGLQRQQITNWFANTRRRKKFRPQDSNPTADANAVRDDESDAEMGALATGARARARFRYQSGCRGIDRTIEFSEPRTIAW
ncbi:hypothetical protein COL154_013748, partial [Colletotrichum chrysophilum]